MNRVAGSSRYRTTVDAEAAPAATMDGSDEADDAGADGAIGFLTAARDAPGAAIPSARRRAVTSARATYRSRFRNQEL